MDVGVVDVDLVDGPVACHRVAAGASGAADAAGATAETAVLHSVVQVVVPRRRLGQRLHLYFRGGGGGSSSCRGHRCALASFVTRRTAPRRECRNRQDHQQQNEAGYSPGDGVQLVVSQQTVARRRRIAPYGVRLSSIARICVQSLTKFISSFLFFNKFG